VAIRLSTLLYTSAGGSVSKEIYTMQRIYPTPEEKVKIAIMKAGMETMLDAVKKGLRFRIVTEEVEETAVNTDVEHK
jgi:hypothetical protein